MTLNSLKKTVATLGRWVAMTLFCISVMAGAWQFSLTNNAAIAGPAGDVISSGDLGDAVKDKAGDIERGSKKLIRDTKNKVERTADRNASKVDQADDEGSAVEGKAKRDRERIYNRAEDHAARTERAVDKSKNAVEGLVDNIKDALN